ncbi:polysaccharide deacetylase family protein [Alteromonas sp. S167]|uniref:polysaccharide deacetylase family protein n=1 Tax=Alteromonas sp. S167 TaxID=3117402 RepID=UPI002FDFC9CE
MLSEIKRLVKAPLELFAGTIGWKRLQKKENTLVILMYHRVLPEYDPRFDNEEPGMIVTPVTFEMHLGVLKSTNAPVMTVEDWVSLPCHKRPKLAFALTFDDGWLDNYEYAFPLLKKFDFPATLYCVTNFIGKPSPFWPNRLMRLLMSDTNFSDPQYKQLCELLPAPLSNKLNKEQAATIVAYFKQYTDEQIYSALAPIKDERTQIEMMNVEQIIDSQNNYRIEIGSHTKNHFRLKGNLKKSELYEEIVASKATLEGLVGKSTDGFCFPNGDFCNEAMSLVEEHYKYSVTTSKGVNSSQDNNHSLYRIGIHEHVCDSEIKFKSRLTGWT